MNILLKGCFAVLLFALSGSWAAAETNAQPEDSYTHTGNKYPPVFFVSNINNDRFKEKFESYQAFSKLDSEAIGLPIGVRVLKGHRTKADGTQFSTLMLSASTLGIIPVVSNTEFKVRYDIFVQGKSIAKFEYQIESTEVDNLWSGPAGSDRENKPSEDLFMEYTLSKFLNELKSSSEAQAVFKEYYEYFPNDA